MMYGSWRAGAGILNVLVIEREAMGSPGVEEPPSLRYWSQRNLLLVRFGTW
jgi:hypothetical protein